MEKLTIPSQNQTPTTTKCEHQELVFGKRAPGSAPLPQPYYEIRRIESKPKYIHVILLDESLPLTEAEKRVFYANYNHVTSGRKIREMMNSHLKTKFKRRFNSGAAKSDQKLQKLVIGLAIAAQIGILILVLI